MSVNPDPHHGSILVHAQRRTGLLSAVVLVVLIAVGLISGSLPGRAEPPGTSIGAPTRADESMLCEPPAPASTEVTADIAVSLAAYSAELKRCQTAGSCSQETLTWYGMTRVTGFVVDAARRDIVVIGTNRPAAVPLRVDDFAVALRSAVNKYATRRRTAQGDVLVLQNPGVTIDPDPAVMRRLDRIMAGSPGSTAAFERRLRDWCTTCELPMTVRLLGLGADAHSHFGGVVFAADLLLKHVANGTASVVGLDSLDAMTLQKVIARIAQGDRSTSVAQLSRFWYLSGRTTFLEDAGAAVLVQADVLVRTEAEQIVGRRITGTGKMDPLAHRFVCTFTRLLPTLAAKDTPYRIFAELENVFRWVALSRIMARGSAFEAAGYRPDFLIDGLVVPRVEVPTTVKGVAHVTRWEQVEENERTRSVFQVRLPSCGGVTVGLPREQMTALPDQDHQLPRTTRTVITARPAKPVIWWSLRM